MLETFELWIRDSLTQSLLLSPLMGAIFGLVFSGLTRGNREGGQASVRETVIIIRERIVVRERAQSNGTQSNDDPMGILIVLLAAMVISIYLYSVYAEDVIYYSSIVTFNVLTFGFSALVFSAVKGRLNSADWFAYTFIPIGTLSFSLILLYQAKSGILPGAKEAAESAGAFKFYFEVLGNDQRNWVIPQLFGLLGTVAFLFFSSVLVIHNLASLQVTYDGFMRPFWRSIYILTNAFSGKFIWFILAALGMFTNLALDGTAYQYLGARNG
ncbi:hypothetical protein [Aeromonas sanarellii]